MTTNPPFLNDLPAWSGYVTNKHVLFDSDAIISTIQYEAYSLYNTLKKLKVTFCLIHPVYIELLRTDNAVKRLERQTLIEKYNFTFLPLTKKEMDMAKDIQTYLLLSRSYTASPTDLYLGGRLATLSEDHIYLLTANLSDFPLPLYTRASGIVLQNNKSSKILYLLNINKKELAQVKEIKLS